jgi:hypothetical protein
MSATIEPGSTVAIYLRRTSLADGGCMDGRHEATVSIGKELARFDGGRLLNGADIPKSDLRWPARCACGYEFQPGDAWQAIVKPIDEVEP